MMTLSFCQYCQTKAAQHTTPVFEHIHGIDPNAYWLTGVVECQRCHARHIEVQKDEDGPTTRLPYATIT